MDVIGNGIGSSDSSVEILDNDLFQISQYVNGLSEFIKVCVTPMTISIQGDWGSGKTSMMNMVKDKLGDAVLPVWFNTWQYSQFNMGDELALSFLGKLIKSLRTEGADDSKINETFKSAYKAIKKFGLIAVDHVIGGRAADELDKLAEKFAKGDDDTIDSINNLKAEFKKSVKDKLNEAGKDRLVVFIDDLDRLHPAKAVELLEVLKVFLDCENCIFILAIDYNVVVQGVKEKYGNLIGEDKGKSFFDKIIQVPFKMPVAHYSIDRFVVEMFKQVNIDLTVDDSTNDYVKLIQASVGCNPRTMKRLFNAYLLLTYISRNVELDIKLDDSKQGVWYKKILFGILCCQQSFEELYNFLVVNSDEFTDGDLLKAMCNADIYREKNAVDEEDGAKQDYERLVYTFKKKSDEEIRRMATFMKLFFKAIDRNGDEDLSFDELDGFKKLLSLTTITSSGNDEISADESLQKEYRTITRQIMKNVSKDISRLVKSLDRKNKINPIYQSNKDTEECKSTWSELWVEMSVGDHGHIHFENTLTVDSETGQLGLKTWTKRKQDFKLQDYKDYFTNSVLVKDKGFTWRDNPYAGIEKYVEDIAVISADEKEQKDIAIKVTEIIKDYLDNL